MKCPKSCGSAPTRWRVLTVDGRPGKHAVSFACQGCGRHRLQLADVQDLEGAVVSIADRYLRDHGIKADRYTSRLDRDEFVGHMLAEAWALWLRWQPDKGIPFNAYLSRFLPMRGTDYIRSSIGRSGNKIQPAPGGLRPGDRLDTGQPTQRGDHPVDRSPDLMRTLSH